MFSIIGIVVVFGAVVAGYLMEHGNLKVLMQPAELIIILGAAIGTVLIANPLHVLTKIGSGVGGAFGGSSFNKQRYLDSLKMMFELFSRARKEGLMSLEADSDAPDQSPVFSKYPKFLKDHHALHFVCDSLRMAASGGIEPFDADQMMELDMDVHHHGATQPVAALSTMADSLPGLGIVAAVLGVVITMGTLGGPPEEIGRVAHPSRRFCFSGWPLLRGFRRGGGFGSVVVDTPADGVHADQSVFGIRVERKAAPGPILGMTDQFSLQRIHVQVVQLLDPFFQAPHVEIVESTLPETEQCAFTMREVQNQLWGGRSLFAA